MKASWDMKETILLSHIKYFTLVFHGTCLSLLLKGQLKTLPNPFAQVHHIPWILDNIIAINYSSVHSNSRVSSSFFSLGRVNRYHYGASLVINTLGKRGTSCSVMDHILG